MAKRSFSQPLLFLSSLSLLAACGGSPAANDPALLLPSLDWYGDNRIRLDGMLDQLGNQTGNSPAIGPDGAPRPVALFNLNDTILKNDLGDAALYYMVRTGAVHQPPGRNWRLTSPYLTAAALQALHNACDSLAEPGELLATDGDAGAACATEIVGIYNDRQTSAGQTAFTGWNGRHIEPSNAWAAALLSGYSSDAARDIGRRALREGLSAQEGATQALGNSDPQTAWLRLYPQMTDLLTALTRRGVDVWLVSSTAQPILEAAAELLAIAPDHVLGTRLLESGGTLTSNLKGCGDVVDGTNDGMGTVTGNALIPYSDGKRCFINSAIFGLQGADALARPSDPSRRAVFAAGDADEDTAMLADATLLRLAINTNAKELMCSAYADAHGSWLVNPMFIEPLAQKAKPYKCTTSACKDPMGKSTPCKDEDGTAIPDQPDKVFVAPPAASP